MCDYCHLKIADFQESDDFGSTIYVDFSTAEPT